MHLQAVTALTNDMMERRLNDKMKDELAESMQACMRLLGSNGGFKRLELFVVQKIKKTDINKMTFLCDQFFDLPMFIFF